MFQIQHLILEITDLGDKKYPSSLVFKQTVLLYIFLAYVSAKYLYDRRKNVSYTKYNTTKQLKNLVLNIVKYEK